MSSPHWYISTYLGKNQTRIRREGFSTRKQCFNKIEQYWPNLNNFAPGYKLEEDPTTTIVVMSKSHSGLRTLHMIITNNSHLMMFEPLFPPFGLHLGPFPVIMIPDLPIIYISSVSPSLSTLTLTRDISYYSCLSREIIGSIHWILDDISSQYQYNFSKMQSNKTIAYVHMIGKDVFHYYEA